MNYLKYIISKVSASPGARTGEIETYFISNSTVVATTQPTYRAF